MKITIILFLCLISLNSKFFAQENIKSKIQIEKERDLYKLNRVKEITVDGVGGLAEITKIGKDGKIIESNGFYKNVESSLVKYKYEKNGNLEMESYYGYESGDLVSTKYYYDEIGNVVGDEEVWGIDEPKGSENQYFYDENGNINRMIKYGTEINYDNQYEGVNLISTSETCNENDSIVSVTKYSYDDENRITQENSFYVICKTNELAPVGYTKYLYFENGLIKRIEKENKYSDGFIFLNYTYKFY